MLDGLNTKLVQGQKDIKKTILFWSIILISAKNGLVILNCLTLVTENARTPKHSFQHEDYHHHYAHHRTGRKPPLALYQQWWFVMSPAWCWNQYISMSNMQELTTVVKLKVVSFWWSSKCTQADLLYFLPFPFFFFFSSQSFGMECFVLSGNMWSLSQQ